MVGKVAVMGLLERHGEDGTAGPHSIVPSTPKRDLQPTRPTRTSSTGATVYTDALPSYDGPGAPTTSTTSSTTPKCYVEGQRPHQRLENFWTLLKRTIKGTYVSVEPFHLFRYLDEQAFRFNNRQDNDARRFIWPSGIVDKRLTYTCAHRLGVAANVLKKAFPQLRRGRKRRTR